MRLRKFLILICIAAITFYVNTGTSAYFTSSVSSQGNIFKAGTLKIFCEEHWYIDKGIDINNLKKGDSFIYDYKVVNFKEGFQSSLDLAFKNIIASDNYQDKNSLLKLCEFDLSLTNLKNEKQGNDLTALDYPGLVKAMTSSETTLVGGKQDGRIYRITIKVSKNFKTSDCDDSDDSDNKQSVGIFKFSSQARQVDGKY